MNRSFLCFALLASLVHCGGEELIARPRVRIISAGGPGDGSLGDLTAAGAILARGGIGGEFDLEIEPGVVDFERAQSIFNTWRAEATSRDLIILSGFFGFMVRDAQCDFGGASVLLIGEGADTCANLRSVRYRAFEPAYLAGVAAVSDPAIAPTRRVGVIAAADVAGASEVMVPFQLGVEARGGTVSEVAFIAEGPEGFFDAPRAAVLATAMAPNVDVIFAIAGPAGVGIGTALEALDESERTYLIGAETDYSTRFASITIGSVLRRVDYTVRDAILEFVGGQLSSGNVEVGFRDRFTELVLSPTYGWRPIGGGCSTCDVFDSVCLSACDTLVELVEAAEAEAREASGASE
ncbi:MAG: basic membrane lipoprotein Med (substrate-binding protein (PBP1-ABC) superfamily) [Polyangiales bacterium]|jgi:basic membrane lipoprotein Med (substrate-binding protein (PBP1-ABC) superfamily)